MAEFSNTAEMNCKVYLNKKRKSQAEAIGLPSRKHVRWGQSLHDDSCSDSSLQSVMMECSTGATGHESELGSVKDSYSICTDADSTMHISVETNQLYRKTFASAEPSTSSISWDDTSSGINMYSLESRALTKSSPVDSGSLPHSCCDHGYGLHPHLDHEEDLLEFGNDADFCSSEYRNEVTEHFVEEELDNMLYSSGIAPNDYVLSSGRWSINQETPGGARKLTIDKEFEEYFSALIL